MAGVSSTELTKVGGVTSAIQTQLDAKSALPARVSSTVSGDTDVTSTTLVDTGHSCTFTTTRANELVLVSIELTVNLKVGSGGAYYLASKLDGDAAIPFTFFATTIVGGSGQVGGCGLISVATPGSHTLKLQNKVDASQTFTVFGTTSALAQSKLETIQF